MNNIVKLNFWILRALRDKFESVKPRISFSGFGSRMMKYTNHKSRLNDRKCQLKVYGKGLTRTDWSKFLD